jgi:hypothetical protein
VWQAGQLLPARPPALGRFAAVAAVLVLGAACVWQRVRPNSDLQVCILNGAPLLSGEEWEALSFMRDNLPARAIVLSKQSHHHLFYCTFSGLAGRRTFLEFYSMEGYSGEGNDKNPARWARIDRVWSADNPAEFSAAVLATGATHLVEFAEHPLPRHFSECLEESWSGPTGAVRVWAFRALKTADPPRSERLVVSDRYQAF